jgi:hypothetical protein
VDAALVLMAVGLGWLIVEAAFVGPGGANPTAEPSFRLVRDPLDLPALRELGLRLDRQGRLAEADAILSFVGRRTWRDRPTEVWLLRRRLDQGRYREAIRSVDAVLRQDARGVTRPVLFDLLIAAADDPQARPALVAELTPAPWWRGDFLPALGVRGAPASAVDTLSALALGPTPPLPDEYAPLISRLVSGRDYEGAYTAWRSVARPHGLVTATLRDGDFTGYSDHTPFTWSPASGAGVSSEVEAAPRALRIDYDGFSAPNLPAQLLIHPPARYRLSWRERVESGDAEDSGRLFWRVRCADTNAVLARGPPPVAGWRAVSLTVEARGAGCPAQWLELAADPGERRSPVTAWYAAFRLQPTP